MTEKETAPEAEQKTDVLSKLEGSVALTPQQKRRNEVRTLLDEHKKQIQMALPKHLTAERLIRVAITAFNKEPKLLDCTVPSLMGCVLQSAQLGLMPDGVLGEAYMIPFRNNKRGGRLECQFMIGYRGMITLAYRSGQVLSFQARAVYERDTFEFEFGLHEKLVHKPYTGAEEKGKLVFVYAVINMKNGGYVMDVMSRQEVEEIRKMSKAPNSDAWVKHYPEMSIKTVIRRIAKRCPLSPEFITAVQLDEKVDLLGESQDNAALTIDLPSSEFSQEVDDDRAEAEAEKNTEEKNGRKEASKQKGEKATREVEGKVTA